MSITYHPGNKVKDPKNHKIEAIEEHFRGSTLCIICIVGTYENGIMQTNSNTFTEWLDTRLPPVGAHVVVLNADDPFCRNYSKELFVELGYEYEDVPIFVINVNNGNLEDDLEAEGQKIELIPSLRDPQLIGLDDISSIFEDAYNLLDQEDRNALLNALEQSDDEGEDVNKSDEEDEDEEPELDEETMKKIRDFVVDDDDTSSSEYDESESDTSSQYSDVPTDMDNLEEELRDAINERDALLAKFASDKKIKSNCLEAFKNSGSEKYDQYMELDEQIRKIKEDLKNTKHETKSESSEEWTPVATRLRRRCVGRTPNKGDQLSSIVAKMFIHSDSEDMVDQSEDSEEDEESEDMEE